ncbi:DUF1360 domain-containing protein [Micromonospora sp. NBC_01813]|uniref:DUF1360 domain-containing protein n=1 Tax=Micromonospora sp. NBC_01813 TaxID=2975988 RepID=UPI002DD82876|nr:DUF1360 domain-containing protein [Micromonospora sp. NBC_01813]WSA11969.1 DUF1360 domain-containing protein [Micromonospora sp. NBC_01813]
MAVRDWIRNRAGSSRPYAPPGDRPLGAYARALTVYACGVAGIAAAVRLTGRRLPPRVGVGDVVLITVATHKLSRLLSKDAVTSPLRAPFTRYEKPLGAGEIAEEVRDDAGDSRHVFGEMVSCPFCLAVWIATAMTSGLVFAPRATRLIATCFTAVAGSDFLQMAYAAARHVDANPPPAAGVSRR